MMKVFGLICERKRRRVIENMHNLTVINRIKEVSYSIYFTNDSAENHISYISV